MQNTEGGRKLNQAMTTTGRAVATTGRAVGGALTQAKGALSTWWSTLTTVQNTEENETAQNDEHNGEETSPSRSYQTVPDGKPYLQSDISPQACQLDKHSLDFETKLANLQNIECSSSTVESQVGSSLSSQLNRENSPDRKENSRESHARVDVPKLDVDSSNSKLKHLKSPRIEII
jgi:Sec-independent protein translocase protein TatA